MAWRLVSGVKLRPAHPVHQSCLHPGLGAWTEQPGDLSPQNLLIQLVCYLPGLVGVFKRWWIANRAGPWPSRTGFGQHWCTRSYCWRRVFCLSVVSRFSSLVDERPVLREPALAEKSIEMFCHNKKSYLWCSAIVVWSRLSQGHWSNVIFS